MGDRPDKPRVLAAACADHLLLRGDPGALVPDGPARFADRYVEAPARFWPALGSAFERVVPWERMTYVHQAQAPVSVPRTPRGVTVRQLTPEDAQALARLRSEHAWIHASRGGPAGLAASGHGWAAFAKGRILSVACTYFLGSAYEDIAVVTVPDRRRERLAPACVGGAHGRHSGTGARSEPMLLPRQPAQPAAGLDSRLSADPGVRPPRHRPHAGTRAPGHRGVRAGPRRPG
ncbi:GNAT family N-acetyltransferase [Streptomyces wuyuanensis]|uniref:GNAT family N-acetyltransferase n=1 Tax=Streptomyces wuyuanensis TaxID=1196353 RepID=UPI003710B16E